MAFPVGMLAFWVFTLIVVYVITSIAAIFYNLFLHPLRKYPGPRAAAATDWWKAYIEIVKGESFVHLLVELHEEYPGGVVRVGPNELHFSSPEAYNTIYNANARWDKEKYLYEGFGEDHSSFGLRKYKDAKERKDVLQPLFSRRAILGMQDLVRKNANHLISILTQNAKENKPSDLLFAFRSFAIDTITTFCFNSTVDALSAPEFKAPIVTAMDASLPTFHLFHHIPPFRKIILSLPPKWAIAASPETAGLTELQGMLGKQIEEITTNPSLLEAADHPIIYHRLLDKTAYRNGVVPNRTALLEEASTMMFAGGVTVGDTLMTGFYHILSNPEIYHRLQTEIRSIWKDKNQEPKWEELEKLPFLTATLKESLRMAPGACSPLLRVVPRVGAIIDGHSVPGGTIVGSASYFIHQNSTIFPEPEKFIPERWMKSSSASSNAETAPGEGEGLDRYLLSFSRGPRSCLGLNLAWCELYTVMSGVVRNLEMEIDGIVGEVGDKGLVWRDCFTPHYPGRHLTVRSKVVAE